MAERMLDVNTRATMSLLEGALASRVPLKRFVLASTYQAYNPFVTTPIYVFDEEKPAEADRYLCLDQAAFRGDLLRLHARIRAAGDGAAILFDQSSQRSAGMLHPAWLNYFIEMTLSNNRIPWFGAGTYRGNQGDHERAAAKRPMPYAR